MSKRYTDTDIWDEDWFLSLEPVQMLFWKYVTDRCDHAGLIRPNKVRFSQAVKMDIDLTIFLTAVNSDKERILILPNGRWWLTGFVQFIYGKKGSKKPAVLVLTNRVHRSVVELLDLNDVPYKSMNYGFEVKETSKRDQKDINKDLIKGLKDKRQKTCTDRGLGETPSLNGGRIPYPPDFEEAWVTYPPDSQGRRNAKAKAFEEWKRIPENMRELILTRIKAYKLIPLPDGIDHPHMRTWLHQRRWDDDLVVKRAASMAAAAAAVQISPSEDPPLTPEQEEECRRKFKESVDRALHRPINQEAA